MGINTCIKPVEYKYVHRFLISFPVHMCTVSTVLATSCRDSFRWFLAWDETSPVIKQ